MKTVSQVNDRPVTPEVRRFVFDLRARGGRAVFASYPDREAARRLALQAQALGYVLVHEDREEVKLTGLGQIYLDRERGAA